MKQISIFQELAIPPFVWQFVKKVMKNPIQAGILAFVIYQFLKNKETKIKKESISKLEQLYTEVANMPKGIKDEKAWNKAIASFKKSYKKEPESDKDYAVVMSIYQKMSEDFSAFEEYKEFTEQFEDNKMNIKERLNKLSEGIRSLARQDMAMRIYKKSFVNLNSIEKKDIDKRLDKQGVSKESMGNLDNDQTDVLEGIVLSNKKKSVNEILKIVKKDSLFKGIKDTELLSYIKDIKKVYRIESVSERLQSLKESFVEELSIKMDFNKKTVQPTLGAMKIVKRHMQDLKKGIVKTRFLVFEGDTLRAAQPTEELAKKYMNKKRVLFSIIGKESVSEESFTEENLVEGGIHKIQPGMVVFKKVPTDKDVINKLNIKERLNKLSENYNKTSKLGKKLLDTLKKGKSIKEVAWWLDYLFNTGIINSSDYKDAYEALDLYSKGDKKGFNESLTKVVRDKNGKAILGGAKVKTPKGKWGYVYQIGDNSIRVTSQRKTGLLGWFKPNELEVKESFEEATYEISTKDGKKLVIARDDKEAKKKFLKANPGAKITDVNFYDKKDRKESFSEDKATDLKQMSQLLKIVGFDQMAKDVLKTKDKKTMLKYIGIVRRNLVKKMSALPTMKAAVPKVIELTDKIAANVNADSDYI